MLAFGGDPALKRFVLDRLAEQRAAGRLVKSAHWQDGKGGAVGCTLEAVRLRRGGDIAHQDCGAYETELGVPRFLAGLETGIFDKLAEPDAQSWPERFIAAIRPGAALEMVWPRFALWLLGEELSQYAADPESQVIADVAALYREWIETCDIPEHGRWARAQGAAGSLADAVDLDHLQVRPSSMEGAYAAYAAAAAADAGGCAAWPAAYAAKRAAAGLPPARPWGENEAAATACHAVEAAYTAAYSAAAPYQPDRFATEAAAYAAVVAAARRQADKLVALLAAAMPAGPPRGKPGVRQWYARLLSRRS